jgi:translation initiation factor IF-1
VAGEEAFRVEGVVVERLPNGTWRVALANGHLLTGFVVGKARAGLRAEPGTRVLMQASPYDLSEGRIIGILASAVESTPSQ